MKCLDTDILIDFIKGAYSHGEPQEISGIHNDVVLISCDKDFESVSELKIEKWR